MWDQVTASLKSWIKKVKSALAPPDITWKYLVSENILVKGITKNPFENKNHLLLCEFVHSLKFQCLTQVGGSVLNITFTHVEEFRSHTSETPETYPVNHHQ